MLRRKRADESRRGIALVVVLGFLAILLILGVAFAISMRVERLAAASFVDNIRARQLMPAALARVMDVIDRDVTNNVYPNWTSPDGVFYSGSGDTIELLAGSASNYVPPSLRNQTWGRWNNNVWLVNGLQGRYAFIAFDCSGLLDASFVGGSNRASGVYPAEISIHPNVIAEINNYTDNTNNALVNNRSTRYAGANYTPWVRFESLPELYRLGRENDGVQQALGAYPDNLFVYSYFSSNQYISDPITLVITNPVYIGADVADLDQAAIQARFTEIGVYDPAALTLNLLDYVDGDNIPRNLGTFCTEPTPLINEVVVRDRITTPDGIIYTNEYQVAVEVWFPFVWITNQNTYRLRITAQYQGSGGGFPNPQSITPANYGTLPLAVPPPGPAWRAGTYFVTNTVWVSIATNMPPALASAEVRVRLWLDELQPNGSYAQVDGFVDVPVPYVNVRIGQAIGAGAGVIYRRAMEVNDPRMNWDAQAQWVEQAVNTDTLGGKNTICNPAAAGCDGVGATNMFVRNGPILQVGELGQLAYTNAPWRTIRLLAPDALPVLDRFTASTNEIRKGLVNPNSFDRDVLAAAFHNVPVGEWPGDPDATNHLISAAPIARAVADVMINTGPYTNLSETTKMAEADVITAAGGGINGVQAEGIIRDTAGLFSPRQNIFTIILAVQLTRQIGADIVPQAEQRAVAVVWRDPYPDANGKHPTFVRFFRWLTE